MSDWSMVEWLYEWLTDNKEWLFSGIGASWLGALIGSIFFKLFSSSKNGPAIIQNSICIVDQGSPGIWENFIGSYRAFNAPWKIEFCSADLSRFVETHIRRYRNSKLRSIKIY